MSSKSKRRAKLTRAYGTDLFLFNGGRSLEQKSKKYNVLPGQHGASRRGRKSEYGGQLLEKQKVKAIYGIHNERQFRNSFKKAARAKGVTGENLLQSLETRLDNVVYRIGFGSTRAESRQLVSHRSVLVNGKMVNIPSYQVKLGDVVSIKESAQKQVRIGLAISLHQNRVATEWIDVDHAKFQGVVRELPTREHIGGDINETLIVELYSK